MQLAASNNVTVTYNCKIAIQQPAIQTFKKDKMIIPEPDKNQEN